MVVPFAITLNLSSYLLCGSSIVFFNLCSFIDKPNSIAHSGHIPGPPHRALLPSGFGFTWPWVMVPSLPSPQARLGRHLQFVLQSRYLADAANRIAKL